MSQYNEKEGEGAIGNLVKEAVIGPDEKFRKYVEATAGFVGIPAAVLEMFLRRRFGTCFISPITMFLAFSLFMAMCVFSFVNEPAGHRHIISAATGTGALIAAFLAGCFLHAIRLWGLIQHMEREKHSEIEGPPLPFFQLLPRGNSYGWVRCVYEPAFVGLSSMLLYAIGIMPIVPTVYFQLAAFCLFAKTAILWFGQWKIVRMHMDRQYSLPTLQNMLDPQKIPTQPKGFVVAQ